jgi:ubiquinone/menaquinone biosynthesis C-methylase UbiE
MRTAPCYSKEDYYTYFDMDVQGMKVLDIGSSIGSFMKSNKFEPAKSRLKTAKKYVTMDIDPDSGADVIGDAHKLPFKKGEFDIILANNVIEHFYDPVQAVAEMHRVLKKDGKIYFTIPFLYPVHEAPHDYSRFTRFGLEKLFERFTEVEIHARGGWFSTTAHFAYKITHIIDKIGLGGAVRTALHPILWLWVQLDRLDKTEAFTRVYFGRAHK